MNDGDQKNYTLTGTYTPAVTGMYELEIRNFRTSAASSNTLQNYIDSISLYPINWMLGSDKEILSAPAGGTRTFYLHGGSQHANNPYWLWVGVSGTYPGLSINGIHIPLNLDMVTNMGLNNPGLFGPGFFGTLDGNGESTATMTVPANVNLMYLTVYFSYIVLSPGVTEPVLAASNPINITMVSFE